MEKSLESLGGNSSLAHYFTESAKTKTAFIKQYADNLENVIELTMQTFLNGHKLLICGNGGSAADSVHWAAEFVGRYKKERPALPAIALNADISALTCIGNDYGYDQVFARQVEALGNAKDVFIGISTSGNSGNVIEGIKKAKEKGLLTVALLGRDGGKIKDMVDFALVVNSNVTARIQECHETIYHTICEEVENRMF